MWSVTGTLHYKAPEMLQGCDYDEKIDSWALGIIAYQLAYHKFPFSS
jgi:serine/threonine protein kinase